MKRYTRQNLIDNKDIHDRMVAQDSIENVHQSEKMITRETLGINFTAMDSQAPYIGGSVSGRQDLFRSFLPGVIRDMTQMRQIDNVLGMTMIGNFLTKEVVQATEQRTGNAIGYSELASAPRVSYATDYETRNTVRFMIEAEFGGDSDRMAEAAGQDPRATKMSAVTTALEIARNEVSVYGYFGGLNKTYGFLNDPNLPAYITLPNGANATPEWSTKTFLERQKDVVEAITSLELSTGNNFSASMMNFTFVIPSSVNGYLNELNDFGTMSLRKFIQETYPRCTIVPMSDLDSANGGANVFYMFVDNLLGDSSDTGAVMSQLVVSKIESVGTMITYDTQSEKFRNSSAGTIVHRPYAIYRATGM